MKKITLISPYEDITAFGIRSISAFIKRAGFETQLIFLSDKEYDLKKRPSANAYHYPDYVLSQVIDICRDSDLIGISLFTYHFDRSDHLTQNLKNKLDIPIIWGGIHPTIRPEESLACCDIVCVGEGEKPLAEILEKMENNEDYFDTKNLWFKHNGGIIKNSLRPLIQDLDSLPFPDYSFDNSYVWDKDSNSIVRFDKKMFQKFFFKDPQSQKVSYMTMTTRGCPHQCSYCVSFRGMYKGQKYLRWHSPRYIVKEIKAIKDKFDFMEGVLLSDDSFFVRDADEIREFSKLYKEKIGLPLRCLGSPAGITEEKLSYLVDAGLFEIHMGIQTASKRTRKLYNRRIPNETVLRVTQNINKFKGFLTPVYDFILDNPYETEKNIAETLKFMLKIPRPFHLQLYSLIFFPGTKLYEKAKIDGLIIDEKRDIYRKQFQYIRIRYLNLCFFLFKYGVPNFLIRPLLNKNMIRIFERKFVNRILDKAVKLKQSVTRKHLCNSCSKTK